jgi:hypothetical protein
MNLRFIRQMKRYLVFTTDVSTSQAIELTGIVPAQSAKNNRVSSPVGKVRLILERQLCTACDSVPWQSRIQ